MRVRARSPGALLDGLQPGGPGAVDRRGCRRSAHPGARPPGDRLGDPASAAADRDPRARIAPPSTEGFCASPFQVLIPAVARPDRRTVADLHRLLVAEGVGALHVTVPGAPPQDTMIEAIASGALARASRVAEASGEAPEMVLGNLFGERWLSGVEVSVRRHGVEEPHVTEHGPLSAATDVEHERIQHLRFRDRADDLEAQADAQAAKVLAERLRVRKERRRAERLEAKLRRVRGELAS